MAKEKHGKIWGQADPGNVLCCKNIRGGRAEMRKGGLWKIRAVGRLVQDAVLGTTEEGRESLS